MKITGQLISPIDTFKPFSITLTFETAEDVEKTLESLRDERVHGTEVVSSLDYVNRGGYNRLGKIYYAIKVGGEGNVV